MAEISGKLDAKITLDLNQEIQGTEIQVPLGSSIAQAVSNASEGDILLLQAGTYEETQPIDLKSGMRLIGKGRDRTKIVEKNSQPWHVISINNAKNVGIAGVYIEGEKQMNEGIWLNDAENIELLDIGIEGFNFSGLWIESAKDLKAQNISVKDSAGDAGGWLTGNIMISELENATFEGISVNDFAEEWGYGIKFTNFNDSGRAKNIEIKHSRIATKGKSLWSIENDVPNFALEIWENRAENINIHHCEFLNMVSFSTSHYEGVPTIDFHHNYVAPKFGESIEIKVSGARIRHNTLLSNRMHNFVNNENHPIKDLFIHNNKIVAGFYEWSEGIISIGDNSDVDGLHIFENEVFQHINEGTALLRLSGNQCKNIFISSNKISRTVQLENGTDAMVLSDNAIENLQILNNEGDSFPVNRCVDKEGNQIEAIKSGNREI